MNQNPNVAPMIIQPANPAAGAGYTLTVPQLSGLPETAPPSQYYKGELGSATLTTSATVATRTVNVTIKDNLGNTLFVAAAIATQAASLVQQYTLWFGDVPVADTSTAVGSSPVIALPRLWLPSGYQIVIGAASIQAGDQFSAISLLVDSLG